MTHGLLPAGLSGSSPELMPPAEPPNAALAEELQLFRQLVREFVHSEFKPHQEDWRRQHHPDAEAWTKAGAIGMLLADIPAEYGGGGGTFAHEVVVLEELAWAGVQFASHIQNVVAQYILAYGTEAQKQDWLPRLARGELVGAVALTEPTAGSDLSGIATRAVRDGDHYVLNGLKSFVTSGWHAGLVCVAVKTDPKAAGMRGISMIAVETKDLPGFRRGRPLEKVGMQGQDTSELFFDDVRVPVANLLGGVEGRGFSQVADKMNYERLAIAVSAVATTEAAVAITAEHVKDRHAFGKALMDLQHTRFTLARCRTEARIGRVFLDDCVRRFLAGQLDEITVAMAKYWLTDTECLVVDECLQLHGGMGYMTEHPIANMWVDSRVHRIYAAPNEIMKEIIALSL
jgi:acyl-CoA dehydrogenase